MSILSEDIEKEHIKIILIGEMSTGKTSLINAYFGVNFNNGVSTTLTPSVSQKDVKIEGTTYTIDMWDTAGQERYRAMAKIFIKDSQIVIFVYDITDNKSFENLDFWVNSVEEVLGKGPLRALVGNKMDLFDKQEVTKERGENYAKEIGATFYESSAKDDAHGFQAFIKQLLDEFVNKSEISKSFGERLSSAVKNEKKKCSC